MISHNIPRTKIARAAPLIVALVFLLILTALAVSNMREVTLESRITSNLIEQKQLVNAAEAGMKDGEYRTIGTLVAIPGKYGYEAALTPVNATDTCNNSTFDGSCVLDIDATYSQSFESNVKDYSPDDGTTTFNETINWYAIPTPGGVSQGESENPEYGNMVMGIGIFRYEVNSRAQSGAGETRLRSTVSRVYN